MKTNEKLQNEIQDAIKWETSLDAFEISVVVNDGVVTLTGTVDSSSKIVEAENAAKKVSGVKVIIEKMEVDCRHVCKKDNEIADEVIKALKLNMTVLQKKIVIKVHRGWIYLNGTLDWNYQREFANKVVSDISGVKGIINNIKIKSELKDPIEKQTIENILDQNWTINYNTIHVDVLGCKVTLIGTVDYRYEKDEAERVAWNIPGICDVDNELTIKYFA
ncbi:BON domain-containing protein [Flavobacterium luteum]|uniref:BON domain-containing protein n=1 Tax=Flavobacterium luteum TaxID=2026654 RepID=A0A7J5AIZ5_9FLAO|nr:BON domain-containing protein [Flavobacterium luteum]KAB1157582.1 BON domain-containing protein [Flavobacterium luteum]